MFVNEYKPACGWLKYNKRKAILDKVKTAGIVACLPPTAWQAASRWGCNYALALLESAQAGLLQAAGRLLDQLRRQRIFS